MPPFLRPSIEHGLPPSRSVLTTKVWQRATALFVESLVGPPGRLPDDGEKMLSSSQVVPLLEESCKEEVRHTHALIKDPSLHPAPPLHNPLLCKVSCKGEGDGAQQPAMLMLYCFYRTSYRPSGGGTPSLPSCVGLIQAADSLLKTHTLLKLGDPIGSMTFFVMRERVNKHAPVNSIEKKAVRVACKVCAGGKGGGLSGPCRVQGALCVCGGGSLGPYISSLPHSYHML